MHIYIHIPFCESKCPYCAFGSYTDKFDLVQKYFNALEFEISNFLLNNPNLKISTLFFGGGTPSSVGAKFYAKIFEILKPKFTKFAEITSEANPNSANLKSAEFDCFKLFSCSYSYLMHPHTPLQ